MSKFRIYNDENDVSRADFFCPGCEEYHGIVFKRPLKGPGIYGSVWKFDKKEETITPSIKVTGVDKKRKKVVTTICHSYVKEGKIQFLNDCTHKLAGKTVKLQEEK